MSKEKVVLRIKASSSVKGVAGCIVNCYEESHTIELRCMGASAVNQMVKSVAIARSILAAKGVDIAIIPGFEDVTENGETKTLVLAKVVEMR